MEYESGRSTSAGISHGEYRKAPVTRKQLIADRIEAQNAIDAPIPDNQSRPVDPASILDQIKTGGGSGFSR